MRILCALLAAWFAYTVLQPLLAPTRLEIRPSQTTATGAR